MSDTSIALGNVWHVNYVPIFRYFHCWHQAWTFVCTHGHHALRGFRSFCRCIRWCHHRSWGRGFRCRKFAPCNQFSIPQYRATQWGTGLAIGTTSNGLIVTKIVTVTTFNGFLIDHERVTKLSIHRNKAFLFHSRRWCYWRWCWC